MKDSFNVIVPAGTEQIDEVFNGIGFSGFEGFLNHPTVTEKFKDNVIVQGENYTSVINPNRESIEQIVSLIEASLGIQLEILNCKVKVL